MNSRIVETEFQLHPVTDAAGSLNLAKLDPRTLHVLEANLKTRLNLGDERVRLALFTDREKLLVGAYAWFLDEPDPSTVARAAAEEINQKLGLNGRNPSLSKKKLEDFQRSLTIKIGSTVVPLRFEGPKGSIQGIVRDKKVRTDRDKMPRQTSLQLLGVATNKFRLTARINGRECTVVIPPKDIDPAELERHFERLLSTSTLNLLAKEDSLGDFTVAPEDFIFALNAVLPPATS